MDDNRGQRRQHEPPGYSASGSRHTPSLQEQSQQQRRPFAGSQGDRFRPAPLGASPSGASRGMSGSTGYSGYYQDTSTAGFPAPTMPQGTMSYHHSTTDYPQPDSRQTQGFGGTYTPTMMYNVQQTGGPQNTAVYDASQQFPSRQAAGMPMMTTDVTTPYFSNEPSNTTPTSTMQTQSASSSTPQVYQQQPGMHGYSTGSMTAIGGGMAAQTSTAGGSTSASADVRMEEEYPGLEEAYANYQAALKETFQNIRDGVLAAASQTLIEVSDWLLSHVVDLGLNSDNQNLYNERIKLWDDFNHAWLAIFQRQKEMMESGQPVQRPQSLISQDGLQKMGKDLVRLCDSIERHGLVDYQYGVWEEQIIEILEECLDLYDPSGTSGAGGGEGSIPRRR
ncbi:hypothetical protein B0J18DRAFT_151935 [Chaetomium sp. MPI-SDFR-AT-0129]|uniref:Uncharacterized protein n=1 Tax=Dichotomopilus funicola TaxID=1934379 RepID=A0AAN6ZSB1_9PEZI|nr:hypothetical protein B0J18DRAFT_151935 [Chaetomium sp. MPI-SDFR-AT-0129]KAK4148224.1 hypothetical protein C8A04DRAFT_24023 [Dichotomopilus funicola]